MPVAKGVVKTLEVFKRGAGRGDDVHAVIDPIIQRQIERARRAAAKLPQADVLVAAPGGGVVVAFNQRNQRQLGGQLAPFQLIEHQRQVAAGVFQRRAGGSRMLEQVVLQDEYLRVVNIRDGKARAQALPGVVHIDRRRLGIGGHGRRQFQPDGFIVWRFAFGKQRAATGQQQGGAGSAQGAKESGSGFHVVWFGKVGNRLCDRAGFTLGLCASGRPRGRQRGV